MAGAQHHDKLTMLSIENLYQQSQLASTQAIQTSPRAKAPLQRRQGFRLPLIRSKPVEVILAAHADDSFGPDDNQNARSFSGDVVLSGLKQPATETPDKQIHNRPIHNKPVHHGLDTAKQRQLPKKQKSAEKSSAQKSRTAKPPLAASELTPDIAGGTQIADDPFLAIKQAVLAAQTGHSDTDISAKSPDVRQAAQPASATLEHLVSQLSHLIEDEVEARLAKAQHAQPPEKNKRVKKRSEKSADTSEKKKS